MKCSVNEALQETQDELEVVKNTLAKMANLLGRRRQAVAGLKDTLDNKKLKLDMARKKNLEMKRRVETEFLKTDGGKSLAMYSFVAVSVSRICGWWRIV